jgi:hypothetical protein
VVRKTDQLKVIQEAAKTDEDRTTLTFTISAPETDWRLPDILSSQNIIPSLEQMIRESVQKYFDSATTAIEKLRDNRKSIPGAKRESDREKQNATDHNLLSQV